MIKLFKLEIKNNLILYISLMILFFIIFSAIDISQRINQQILYLSNDFYKLLLFIIFLILPISIFQVFTNEKYPLYFILSTSRLKQFIIKLIIPFTIFFIYIMVFSLKINLFSLYDIDSIRGFVIFINLYAILPSLLIMCLFVFIQYNKKFQSNKLFLYLFSATIFGLLYFIIFYLFTVIHNKFDIITISTYLLFDLVILIFSYIFYSKIEV